MRDLSVALDTLARSIDTDDNDAHNALDCIGQALSRCGLLGYGPERPADGPERPADGPERPADC